MIVVHFKIFLLVIKVLKHEGCILMKSVYWLVYVDIVKEVIACDVLPVAMFSFGVRLDIYWYLIRSRLARDSM